MAESMCGNTQQINYTNLSGNIAVNGLSVISFTNLASGLFLHSPFPVDANGINVSSVTLENALYVAVGIDIPEIYESVEVVITLNKTGYIQVQRRFTVFGYDIGRNPNIGLTSINPDFYFVMLPVPVIAEFATTGEVVAAIGNIFTITADFAGVAGNSINIVSNGFDTIEELVTAWNIANPLNTATVVYSQGGAYSGGTPLMPFTGGVNGVPEDQAFADFVGWRKPFTNDLYLFANYSNIQDTAEYFNVADSASLATTHSALLFCSNVTSVYLTTKTQHGCGCGHMETEDECTTDEKEFIKMTLIPAFSVGVTCVDCCSEDDCLVITEPNFVQFILDVDAITPLNVDDVEVVSIEEVELNAILYDACGNEISTDSLVTPLNPLAALEDTQIPITLPDIGDFIVKVTMTGANGTVFICTKIVTIEGCYYYSVTKTECNKHLLKNHSLSSLTYSVEQLSSTGVWTTVLATATLLTCTSVEITFATDGIYRITIDEEVYRVFVQDCFMKACYVDYVMKRVCNPKAACACGGNCGGLCDKTPVDLYDFNAFMLLVYNYFGMLNGLYVKNWVFTIFQPSDLERLVTIVKLLERIKEYCGNCQANITVNQVDCGCKH